MEESSPREALLASIIRERMTHDKRVGDLPVTIHVVEGDVYLVGRVDTLEQRDIMEYIVRGTLGVRNVNTDELEVAELAA